MKKANPNMYLKKRKNRDVWMINKRIHKSIRHLYDGKKTLEKSLKTTCVKTARLRRDAILGEMAKQLEMAIDGGRATFISFYNTLDEAKRKANGDKMEAFYQLDIETLVGSSKFPEIQNEAWKAANTGIIPMKYTYTIRESLQDWLRRNKDKNHDTISKMKSTTERFLRHINHTILHLCR